jgi:hypothetical protein
MTWMPRDSHSLYCDAMNSLAVQSIMIACGR